MIRINWNELWAESEDGTRQAVEVKWGVDAVHPAYAEMMPVWKQCRNAREGGVNIKGERALYLPKLNGKQSKKDYDDYLSRAYWYGATGKTVSSFVSMIFRRSPTISDNGEDEAGGDTSDIDDLFTCTTSDGRDAEKVLREIVEEVFVVNRVGALEDFPAMVDEDGVVFEMTVKEAEDAGLTSTTSLYAAEDIINWMVEEVQGEMVPTMFVLRENREAFSDDDPFQHTNGFAYRMLFLEEVLADTEEGPMPTGEIRYGQAVFVTGKDGFILESLTYPMQDSSNMDRIPFWIFTEHGIEYTDPLIPVIYDLAEVNLGHYRNSADYEREMHRVSMKTAVFPGWDKKKHGIPEIGGSLAGPPDQQPFILEAMNASPLNEEMRKKEERMATLGAQLLAQQGRFQQAAETAKIQSRGETSIVASIARAVASGSGTVFTFKAHWSNVLPDEKEVSVEMNTDFDETPFTGEDLTKLMELLQSGTLSYKSFYHALEALEVYPEGWSIEKELEAIADTEEMLASAGQSEEMAALHTMIMELESRIDGKGADDEEAGNEDPNQQDTEPVGGSQRPGDSGDSA